MRRCQIGIVGGGIGGIATALALRQVGVPVVVYERADCLREVGAGMMLWPNATRVLRGLGLLDQIVARSGPNTHFLVRAANGRILMNIAWENSMSPPSVSDGRICSRSSCERSPRNASVSVTNSTI